MGMGEKNKTSLDIMLNLLENKKKLWYYERWESTIEAMVLELRLLKLLLQGLDYWEERKNCRHLQSAMHNMMPELSQMVRRFMTKCDRYNDDETLAFDFHETIKRHLRPQARKFCITFLAAADHKCMSCPTNYKMFVKYVKDMESFVDFLKQILNSLLNSNLNIAPVMKQHVSTIGSEMENFQVNVDSPIRLFDLIPHARAWLNRVSCLMYLYWIDGSDGSLASTVLLPKSIPVGTSGVISSYFQPRMIPQLLAAHLDFILDNLDAPIGVDTEMLREGLIFLLSFVLDALEDDSADRGMIWTQMYALVDKFPSLVYSMANFSDMLLKIGTLKEKVTKLYLATPYSSQSWSSNTNAMGFLDSLVGNLKKLIEREMNPIRSLKHMWELLFTELESLKPLLKNIMERDETQKLWREIMGMVYNADYLIRICHLRSFSAWYGIVALPYVIERLKCMKMEINDHNTKKLGHCDQMERTVALQPRGTNSEIEKFFMRFVEDERVIYDELMRGLKALTIISISGSGGQGKTTFAKRMYNDLNVQCHFQKTVWCYVSKDCPVKELLAQILSKSDDSNGNGLEMQDLIERVRKSLKGRRYLIVMDDIWGVDVWSKLESSFPNDNNGSRIMFTSRNHDLASQVKLNSVSRRLPLFSDEQSWELMKKSVFGSEGCDEVFVEIGRKLASCCKGLPLAVALIAAVLRRTERNLDFMGKSCTKSESTPCSRRLWKCDRAELYLLTGSFEIVLSIFWSISTSGGGKS